MTDYERLIQEATDKGLKVKETSLRNLDGLIKGNKIALRSDMTTTEKYCALGEELAHHELTVGNILAQNKNKLEDVNNIKQEYKAHALVIEKFVPIENILFALADHHIEPWDMADYIGVTQELLMEALAYYKSKAVIIG